MGCRCAVSESKGNHLKTPLDTIKNAIEWAKSWKMLRQNKNPPSFDGLVHTLTAVSQLWGELESEGKSYLLTNILNQDPLDNEFGIARQKGGFERNPSVKVFRENLKHRLMVVLIKPPSGTSCEQDEDELLIISDNPSTSIDLPTTSDTSAKTLLTEPTEEWEMSDAETDDNICEMRICELANDNETLEACAVRYFAGFAVRCCLKKYKCEICKIELTRQVGDGASRRPDETLIENKTYQSSKGQTPTSLTTPSDQITRVARIALDLFDKHLDKQIHKTGFLKALILKSKRAIHRYECSWLENEDCRHHRSFFLKKILTARLKRKLNEMSKELRQPKGKSTKPRMKLTILQTH